MNRQTIECGWDTFNTEPSAVAPDARVNFSDTISEENFAENPRTATCFGVKLTLASGATALGSVMASLPPN